MDIEYLKSIKENAKRELAKQFYEDYVEYSHFGLYKHARHTRLICKKLEEVLNGRDKRVMIFCPPRHSKSMTITETFPSYYLLKNPNKRVIIASYGDSLAQQFGRRNKQKIEQCGDLFGLTLSATKSSSTLWEFEGYRGGLLSTGIGGSITGQGANLLIIDDPIKNEKEAQSKTFRDRVHSEYNATLRTRLQPGGSIIIILTRWHEDDLAGRLLNGEEKWEVISLPALCESEDDLLHRKIGEPLFPEIGFDEKWAEKTKKEVGSRTWSSLYQQRPAPAEGNIINRNWWRYYTQLPRSFDYILQSWDFTFKEKQEADYVVGQVWGKVGADAYLIDQIRTKADFVKSCELLLSLTNKYPKAKMKLIEDKANGTAIISALKQKINGIIPINPEGSKEARVYAVTPYLEAGNVYLPSPDIAPWVDDFILECTLFPNGANDDQVDSMSQAINKMFNMEQRINVMKRF